MRSIGAGVRELRVRDQTGAIRVIYFATRREAVYVLHAFQKKTQGMRPASPPCARPRSLALL